jgi:hypothetical protein
VREEERRVEQKKRKQHYTKEKSAQLIFKKPNPKHLATNEFFLLLCASSFMKHVTLEVLNI